MATKWQYRELHPYIYGSGGRDRTCDPTHVSEINPVYIGFQRLRKLHFKWIGLVHVNAMSTATFGSGRRFLEKSPCHHTYNHTIQNPIRLCTPNLKGIEGIITFPYFALWFHWFALSNPFPNLIR